jgi:hypothetical protein
MKPVKISAIVAATALIVSLAAFINRSAASKPNNSRTVSGDGFAVLELFTSEGCSSCPPADELLARIQQEAGNKPVYILSYHVDYWNRLGWKDVFSQPQFSKRQYQYGQQLAAQVYTPQLIINGKAEFVGSDESAIAPVIKDALSSKATNILNLQATQQGTKININYQADGNTDNSKLLLALVQKHAVSKVEKGENEGRTLHHAQIVRNLYTFNLTPAKKGTEQINLSSAFNSKDWEIIGLVQNVQTGEIKGAARAAIDSSTANF